MDCSSLFPSVLISGCCSVLSDPFCYWPKERLMDTFYCFQASGGNFRYLKDREKKCGDETTKSSFFPPNSN